MGQWETKRKRPKGRGYRKTRKLRRRAYRPTCEHEPDILSNDEAWSRWAMEDCAVVACPWRHCEITLCRECRAINGGVGPLGCLCDLTPGWHAKFVDGMGKPSVPVKARGRHGGRVQRSRARKAPALALRAALERRFSDD